MPNREVLTINVGGAGVNIGTAITEQYMTEHGIGTDGTIPGGTQNGLVGTFFEETGAGQYVARQLSVDLDPSGLDTIRNSRFASGFHPEFLLTGKEDAAGNFARGHYTVGKEIMDQVNDRMRKLAETTDNFQGFIVHHSLGGGTGSGLGTRILERMGVDYRTKSRFGFEVLAGDIEGRSRPCEVYNEGISQHWLLDHTDVSVLFDNRKLGQMCKDQAGVSKPGYGHVNALIAKVASGFTGSLRFGRTSTTDLIEMRNHLVPFPRLHFMTSSFAGLVDPARATSRRARTLACGAVQPENMVLGYTDYSPLEDKFLGCSLDFRGDVSSEDANDARKSLTKRNHISFVEWCPTGLKVLFNQAPIATVEDSCIAADETSCTMVGNNVAIRRQAFSMKKFDLMYSQRAYVHQYTGEGMEEGKIREAREALRYLEKDYLDVLAEQGGSE